MSDSTPTRGIAPAVPARLLYGRIMVLTLFALFFLALASFTVSVAAGLGHVASAWLLAHMGLAGVVKIS